MTAEWPTPELVEAKKEYENIKAWYSKETRERKPGDRGEYYLHQQKPEVLKCLSPILLSTLRGSIPVAREDLLSNGLRTKKGPDHMCKEVFLTIFDNTTYEVEYTRDYKGILHPKEIKLVYTSPENK